MRNRIIYNYEVSFETGDIGKRVKKEQSGFNITEVIQEIRRKEPNAHMFIVIKKKKQTQPISGNKS